jgi:hypothetical protein
MEYVIVRPAGLKSESTGPLVLTPENMMVSGEITRQGLPTASPL